MFGINRLGINKRDVKAILKSGAKAQVLQRILFDAIICRIRKIKISHF